MSRSSRPSYPSEGLAAADLIREAAKAVGGGGGGKGDIATAGGKDPDGSTTHCASPARQRTPESMTCARSASTSARSGSASPSATRSGTIASPLTVVHRSRSRRVDLDEIARIARDEEVELIVVGLPLTMRGEVGHAAEAAIAEAGRLATVVGVPVETHDERLTTVTADRSMIEAGMRGEARRRVVDKVAAAVMLQSWLDAGTAEHAMTMTRSTLMTMTEGPTDWEVDPWDSPAASGSVERLRRETRVVKWAVWTMLVVAVVLVLVAGRIGWWYVKQINPEGPTGRARQLHGRRGRHDREPERASGGGGHHRQRRGVPLVRRAQRRARAHPGLLPAAPERSHRQHHGHAAHAAGPDLQQGHVPRGLHDRTRWPTGSRSRAERMTAAEFLAAATDPRRRLVTPPARA